MKYIPQIPQPMMNRFTDGTPARKAQQFPQNLAGNLDPDVSKRMLIWLNQNYIWPQVQERVPFERMWDKLLEMSRITVPYDEVFANTQQADSKAKNNADQSNMSENRVSDSLIHDAVQRLTDITYFIAFKEGLPCQFGVPDYIKQPNATSVYRPLSDRIDGGNALLQWNSGNNDLKRNSNIAYRHHYLYGCSFVMSDFQFRVEAINRQMNDGSIVPVPEITKIGTTFEPISIRKIWFNWRLPVYDMDSQPCPFFFEEIPRFAILQNAYDPMLNPFGYLNLDKLQAGTYIYSEPEMTSVRNALQISLQTGANGNSVANAAIAQILQPKYSVEAKWTLFPVMPFDPQTGLFEKDAQGNPLPFQRFVMETFGPNIHSGSQVILRLQENYYPKKSLPIYASCHMPDLDSGAYAPAIGQILFNHYRELCLMMEQFLDNKDLMNDCPAWVQASSPARNVNLNAKGAKIVVNGPNDFGWKQQPDASMSMVQMMQYLREQGQTTSKSVDAIMGKAMGSRTSATEAQNAFQSSMSAITTDIDMVSADLHGPYAQRVWDYSGMWMDPDLLQEITGQFGFALSPEDMWMNIGIITNVGSTYIEKIIKQQNIRYVLEASAADPTMAASRSKLWKELLEFMGFDPSIIEDGDQEEQIQKANQDTCLTYLGYPVLVDPDSDHQIYLKVITAYIKNRNSVWNTTPEYAPNVKNLLEQIKQHQFYIQLQQQMMLAQQQMQVARAQLSIHQDNPPQMKPVPQTGGSAQPTTPGQVAQQGAGAGAQ